MDERTKRIQRMLDWPIVIAAALVIPILILEESDLGQPWDTIALISNWSVWTAFAVELIVMLVVVPKKREWLRKHPLEVAVVVLTPPFLSSSFQALRALRLLRVLRILAVAKVIRRLFSPEGLQAAAIFAAFTCLAGGAAFAAVEKQANGLEGLYWAVSTMTTVGYGDLAPETPGGRVIAVVVMLVGIGFIAVLTGAIAQRFLAPSVKQIEKEVDQIDADEEAVLREVRELGDRLRRLEAMLTSKT
jgi:voltage-gated potassium channel